MLSFPDSLFCAVDSAGVAGAILLQCLFWAGGYTGIAEDALRAVDAGAGVVRHVHVHRADLLAFSAGDALRWIDLDAHDGIIARRF